MIPVDSFYIFSRQSNCLLIYFFIFCGAVSPLICVANATDENKIYKTREEQRDDWIKHQVTPWLTASGSIEFEYTRQKLKFKDITTDENFDQYNTTAQMELLLTPSSILSLELIFEYNDEQDDVFIDEAIAAMSSGAVELEIGKLYLPFGEYYSQFINGPMLEFSETREEVLVLSFEHDDNFNVSAFVYQGEARKINSNNKLDWGILIEFPLSKTTLGGSYLSDLADSEHDFLNESSRYYEKKVDALSLYAVFEFDHLILTAELVAALKKFNELDAQWDKPLAWNIECGYYLSEKFSGSIRVEGSSELEDEPTLNTGISVVWYINKHTTIRNEFFYGWYHSRSSYDEQKPDNLSQFFTQLSIDF